MRKQPVHVGALHLRRHQAHLGVHHVELLKEHIDGGPAAAARTGRDVPLG